MSCWFGAFSSWKDSRPYRSWPAGSILNSAGTRAPAEPAVPVNVWPDALVERMCHTPPT